MTASDKEDDEDGTGHGAETGKDNSTAASPATSSEVGADSKESGKSEAGTVEALAVVAGGTAAAIETLVAVTGGALALVETVVAGRESEPGGNGKTSS